uniref:Uncharacterized protein n=2 Tax=Streptomyces sp. FR1 TaxID=349971 RepID=V9Z3H3_9ACTN|nr:hypothetical protein pFRL2_3 [Streptomyces sp. FR1]
MTGPTEPPDRPGIAEDRDNSRSRSSPDMVVLVACMSVIVLLMLGGFVLYLAWQHPSLAVPLGTAATVITVPVTVFGTILVLTKR